MRLWKVPRVGRREDWFAWRPVVLDNGYSGEDSPVVVWLEKVRRTKHGNNYLYTKWERPNCNAGVHAQSRSTVTAHQKREALFHQAVRDAEAKKLQDEIAANGS